MKTKFSNLSRAAALLAAILCLVAVFSSCNRKQASSGICTVVIENDKAYEVDLSGIEIKEGLFSVLDALRDRGEITFEAERSATGAYLTAVQQLKNGEPANSYLMIWTSVEADFDVSGMFGGDRDYQGTRLCCSGVGASQMTVCDGAVIYIGMMQF